MTPAELLKRALGKLEHDWDSYGSVPPTVAATKMAETLITITLAAHGACPNTIVPVSGGGVQLEWTMLDMDLEVCIDHDGHFTYLDCKEETHDPR